MRAKEPGRCQCSRMQPISCGHAITQEDLLCDDCREGCNAAFGAVGMDSPGAMKITGYRGFHMRTEIRFG